MTYKSLHNYSGKPFLCPDKTTVARYDPTESDSPQAQGAAGRKGCFAGDRLRGHGAAHRPHRDRTTQHHGKHPLPVVRLLRHHVERVFRGDQGPRVKGAGQRHRPGLGTGPKPATKQEPRIDSRCGVPVWDAMRRYDRTADSKHRPRQLPAVRPPPCRACCRGNA